MTLRSARARQFESSRRRTARDTRRSARSALPTKRARNHSRFMHVTELATMDRSGIARNFRNVGPPRRTTTPPRRRGCPERRVRARRGGLQALCRVSLLRDQRDAKRTRFHPPDRSVRVGSLSAALVTLGSLLAASTTLHCDGATPGALRSSVKKKGRPCQTFGSPHEQTPNTIEQYPTNRANPQTYHRSPIQLLRTRARRARLVAIAARSATHGVLTSSRALHQIFFVTRERPRPRGWR